MSCSLERCRKSKALCSIILAVLILDAVKIMKIPKLVMIISLSTVILSVLSTSRNFQMTRMSNGSQLCSNEKPSVTLYLSELPPLESSSNSCLPPSVRCSWECANDPECTNFNYYETDPGICEQFHYTPTNCSSVVGCIHFQARIALCTVGVTTGKTRCPYSGVETVETFGVGQGRHLGSGQGALPLPDI